MSFRFVVLSFALPSLLLCQEPARVQPGTTQKPDVKVETVEADHSAITTESKLVAGAAYTPATADDRVEWWARRAFSVDSLAIGAAKTAIKTWWLNSPKAWGRGLDGFGKRFGNREFEVLAGNGIEAGLGTIWGEDPRYFHCPEAGFGPRVKHAIYSAFFTYRNNGSRKPAYARFIGIVGARGISMAWYPEDERTVMKASLSPLGVGLAGRVGGNLFREFKPDLYGRIFKKKK